MLNEILSALFQILAFSLIPFVVYLIQKKTTKGFLNYIGLKKSTAKANGMAVLASLIFLIPPLGLILFNDDFREIMTQPSTMTGKFKTMGPAAKTFMILFMAAVFKTALAEEILFRGFIAKRLMRIAGYYRGNVMQAVIFGLLHLVLFLTITNNPLFLSFIMIFTTVGAYLFAYINEKQADGSIIPSWISHGLANVVSYAVVAFLI
jgi:uncharacterized protein